MGGAVARELTRNEMLREVMRVAHARHYTGPGAMWGWTTDAERAAILAQPDSLDVLRSTEFCQRLWGHVIHAQSTAGSMPADISYDQLPDDALTRWQGHFEILQAHPDPLEYCYLNM